MPQVSSAAPAELSIHAEQAFTGHAVERDVLIAIGHGRIVDVARSPTRVPDDALRSRFVLPGLVDSHVHLAYPAGGPLGAATVSDGHMVEHSLQALKGLLARGVTTVRDLGCTKTVFCRVRHAVEADPYRYPRLIGSGPPITSPGGHLAGLGTEVASEKEARAAVALCIDAGAKVVKVIVTGGRMTPGTPMGRLTLDPQLLAAAVDEAHRGGVPVAAHVHGTEGIAAAVGAGVDTLEHCSWTDAQSRVRRPVSRLLEEMRARGQVIVTAGPLPSALAARISGGARQSSPGKHRLEEDRRTRRQLALWRNAWAAHEAGVTVAIGTDSMFGALEGFRDLAARVVLMHEMGGWPLEAALAAVTRTGAYACGAPHGLGVIAPGAVADIAEIDADPRDEPASLLDSRVVVYRGRRVPRRSEVLEVPA